VAARLISWVRSANEPGCDFPLENLPYCRFNGGREGTVIGDSVLDVAGIGYDRQVLTPLLREDSVERPTLHRIEDVRFDLPVAIPNYTDFYASIHHATNVGRKFRPDDPLLPNYRHVPIAYHGRASSIILSGTDVRRPRGQLGGNRFGPTEELDYEMELGLLVKHGNTLGEPVPITRAHDHMLGFVLVNDWSARDIQRWEYRPLGPFLGKSFATSISPLVVSPEALEPYRIAALDRQDLLPYLRPAGWLYDITVEVRVNGRLMGRSNTRDLYWTFEQMLAHHTSNGCNLQDGDLLASGTISGEAETARGCLLELGDEFLEDGDEVVLRGYAEKPGLPRIGFGECRALIRPALS
jgi:fumarylacetoacetase